MAAGSFEDKLKLLNERIKDPNPLYDPFYQGWTRAIIDRRKPTSKKKYDIYYYTSKRIRLRSIYETEKYLKTTGSSLRKENFSFSPILIGLEEPFEIRRKAMGHNEKIAILKSTKRKNSDGPSWKMKKPKMKLDNNEESEMNENNEEGSSVKFDENSKRIDEESKKSKNIYSREDSSDSNYKLVSSQLISDDLDIKLNNNTLSVKIPDDTIDITTSVKISDSSIDNDTSSVKISDNTIHDNASPVKISDTTIDNNILSVKISDNTTDNNNSSVIISNGNWISLEAEEFHDDLNSLLNLIPSPIRSSVELKLFRNSKLDY